MTNLHPIHDRTVQRAERETANGHRAGVVWLTGLSGSGKSTIATAVERELFAAGHFVVLLDGDNVRTGLCADLGFSLEDREENIRRIAEVARLFVQAGAQVLCTFVSPTRQIRALARSIIGAEDFMEVYVNTPLATCEARDVKGLYAKARRGEIKGFTGIDSPYEAPEAPDLDLPTANQTVAESAQQLILALRAWNS
ncbi:adenylyl-sulfate kinase [Neolewinella lacunae]|uniref:Adenylyl-sulfate kinase n=1 Tax=Neolewinella lacunae TaxID=1517758 RepID=A0A923PRG8_9BACT|nr:adenylyl-sulfate kinase [Neolewinella lacunae]MBC6996139.1 adenylyl-sulfate kinase [Neolewinella lacunae]MDN3633992.1 adenylyl-sulfate kinase [Neolewinella lacunae]